MAGSHVPYYVTLEDGALRRGYSGHPLVAKTNAERARSANQITVGANGF
jgi:hypothetical protein